MLVDSLPRNYTKVPQHFNDKVYIQLHMIAQATFTQAAAAETEPDLTGTVCVCAQARVCVCVFKLTSYTH